MADGRGFRTLNIVDDFTRECVAIEVDRSLLGLRVARLLDRLLAAIGLPQSIVLDAKAAIEAWRIDYNTVRPHSSLAGRHAPAVCQGHGGGSPADAGSP